MKIWVRSMKNKKNVGSNDCGGSSGIIVGLELSLAKQSHEKIYELLVGPQKFTE